MGKLRIGVLSYQGSVIEHLKAINSLENAVGVEVKTLEALNSVDGLIIPGGESTTIGKLLDIFGLKEPLKKRIEERECAGGNGRELVLVPDEEEQLRTREEHGKECLDVTRGGEMDVILGDL